MFNLLFKPFAKTANLTLVDTPGRKTFIKVNDSQGEDCQLPDFNQSDLFSLEVVPFKDPGDVLVYMKASNSKFHSLPPFKIYYYLLVIELCHNCCFLIVQLHILLKSFSCNVIILIPVISQFFSLSPSRRRRVSNLATSEDWRQQ